MSWASRRWASVQAMGIRDGDTRIRVGVLFLSGSHAAPSRRRHSRRRRCCSADLLLLLHDVSRSSLKCRYHSENNPLLVSSDDAISFHRNVLNLKQRALGLLEQYRIRFSQLNWSVDKVHDVGLRAITHFSSSLSSVEPTSHETTTTFSVAVPNSKGSISRPNFDRPNSPFSFHIEYPVKECAAGRHCCVHAALSFTLPIIHPPAPSTSQPLLLRPVVTGSILLPRIRRDGNLAESFAIYDGANAPPPARTYFGLYASKMNSVICRSLDNDITDTATYVSANE
ncbi:hypothetical protein EAG_02369 [Camponotus floridanus]|uniref:Uncharacterized protein n=1 Tax=Camponotus floridanus TaxID=104421 RepID=E2ASL0_CAMFO|nr:hypothetical protein EAG_02369 [Camponotus floridanus]